MLIPRRPMWLPQHAKSYGVFFSEALFKQYMRDAKRCEVYADVVYHKFHLEPPIDENNYVNKTTLVSKTEQP